MFVYKFDLIPIQHEQNKTVIINRIKYSQVCQSFDSNKLFVFMIITCFLIITFNSITNNKYIISIHILYIDISSLYSAKIFPSIVEIFMKKLSILVVLLLFCFRLISIQVTKSDHSDLIGLDISVTI